MRKISVAVMVAMLTVFTVETVLAGKNKGSEPNSGYCNGKYMKDVTKCKKKG